jgi:EpsI family protein
MAEEGSVRAGATLSRAALFGPLLALGALAYRHLLFWDPSGPGLPSTGWFFFRVSETAPQILFALAVPLFYRRRERIARALRGEGAPGSALPLLALGAALFLWGHYTGALDLVLASFLAVSLGSALLLSGRHLARELALPLLFLAFATPVPAVLVNYLIYPLQLSTAQHTGWLLNAIGITAVQEGNVLFLVDHSFQIIESCSGLRSIFVLTTLAVGWLSFFPTRRLPAVLLIASAPAIAYLVNTLRILSLVLSPSSDLAGIHSLQGVGIFLLGLLILYGVDKLLQRIPGGSEDEPETAASPYPVRGRQGVVIALALLLAAMLGASAWGPRWDAPERPRRSAADPPEEIDGWRLAAALTPDRLFLGSVASLGRWYGEYEREGETVFIFVGYDDRLDRSGSLISPKNAVPGAGWHVEERTATELARGGPRVDAVLARSGASRMLTYHWYEGTDPLALEVLRSCLATDQSLLRRPGGAWVVRLSTDVAQTRDGKERAEARLRSLAELIRPYLDEP